VDAALRASGGGGPGNAGGRVDGPSARGREPSVSVNGLRSGVDGASPEVVDAPSARFRRSGSPHPRRRSRNTRRSRVRRRRRSPHPPQAVPGAAVTFTISINVTALLARVWAHDAKVGRLRHVCGPAEPAFCKPLVTGSPPRRRRTVGTRTSWRVCPHFNPGRHLCPKPGSSEIVVTLGAARQLTCRAGLIVDRHSPLNSSSLGRLVLRRFPPAAAL